MTGAPIHGAVVGIAGAPLAVGLIVFPLRVGAGPPCTMFEAPKPQNSLFSTSGATLRPAATLEAWFRIATADEPYAFTSVEPEIVRLLLG